MNELMSLYSALKHKFLGGVLGNIWHYDKDLIDFIYYKFTIAKAKGHFIPDWKLDSYLREEFSYLGQNTNLSIF